MPGDATGERLGDAAGAARERIRDDIHALFDRAADHRTARGNGDHRSARALGGAAAAAAGLEAVRVAARRRRPRAPAGADEPVLTVAAVAKAVAKAAVAAGVFTVSVRREGRSPRVRHALAYVGVSVAASLLTTHLHARIRASAPPKR